jgi:pimeloyl-ACP methyl ester carboxylesterase
MTTLMKKPTHYRHRDIVFEHLPPSGEDRNRWVVLCDGLPAMPHRHELMAALAAAGWHVVLPRYVGTWESPGEFLVASPTDDITAVIEATVTGQLVPGMVPATNVTLLGTSFGGAVALCLAKHPAVTRVVALSPVVSFKTMADSLATLPGYLREMYPGAYRFSDTDWRRLMSDALVCPLHVNGDAIMKTAIIAGCEDPQVPVDAIAHYASGHAHFFLAWPGKGHLGFSQVTGDLLTAVLAIIDSAEAGDEWAHEQLEQLQ